MEKYKNGGINDKLYPKVGKIILLEFGQSTYLTKNGMDIVSKIFLRFFLISIRIGYTLF